MVEGLYHIRFELFLSTQIAILFGSLIVPIYIFEAYLDPILFLFNLLAGVLFLSKKPRLMWFCIILLFSSAVIFGISTLQDKQSKELGFFRMTSYFLFYLAVSYEIIKQVWQAKYVSKNVIFGLISGYISLGLIGFFICISIEIVYPGSFQDVLSGMQGSSDILVDRLMYFSFITLMTIGYGDILPITDLAQKAAMLIGLVGQFYLVIITAAVVGKYIAQRGSKEL